MINYLIGNFGKESYVTLELEKLKELVEMARRKTKNYGMCLAACDSPMDFCS